MEGPAVGQDWYTNLCDTGSCADCSRAYFVGCHQYGRTRHRLIRLDNRQDPLDLSHYRPWNKGCLSFFFLCVPALGIGSGVLTSKHTQNIRRAYGIKGNHCRDIATGIFCQPCSLLRNDIEIRRRESDKEGHELAPGLSPPVPQGEDGFQPMYSMPVTEGYQSEPLMTTPSSGLASRSDGQSHPSEPLMTTATSVEVSAHSSHRHSSEHLRVRATSVAKSTRRSRSHPEEPLVGPIGSVPESPGGSHVHPSELLVAVVNSLATSSRASHSHPSETLVPTSSPVAASSHEARAHQDADEFTTQRMFPTYPADEDTLKYERYWEESSPSPRSPVRETPLNALDQALDALDRRSQLLTPISEGESLEDMRGRGKENRIQFPQIRNWLKGMSPQPDKSPVDSAVLSPGPGTSPVVHEQQHVMSQRGSPSPDTSGHRNDSHDGLQLATSPSKAKTSTVLSEPQQRPPIRAEEVLASSPDDLAVSSSGSQRQHSTQVEALMSSPYSVMSTPSASGQHRLLHADTISSTDESRHSHSVAREVMGDVPDGSQPYSKQHSTWAYSDVPAAIDSPMPLRGISPGKMFELLTITDPENYLIDVAFSPEDSRVPPEELGLSLKDISSPSQVFRSPSEPTRLPSERTGVLADEVRLPADDSNISFDDVAVSSDLAPAHSSEVLSDGDTEFDHSFGASSDGKRTASFNLPFSRQSARSLTVHSERESARSVRVPSEEPVLLLDNESTRSFSSDARMSDGIIFADQGSNLQDIAESDTSLRAESQTLEYIPEANPQMSQDVIPTQEKITSVTPDSAPEPQGEQPSAGPASTTPAPAPEAQIEQLPAEPSNDRDFPTRPQVSTSDVPLQERNIGSATPISASKPSESRDHSLSKEYHLPTPTLKRTNTHGIAMIERLPTPELTRHLGDEMPEPSPDQPAAPPKAKGWAQRAASPVFTLIRQYSFRAGKRASARSTEDSTLGDDRAASPAPSLRGRESVLSGDHGEAAVIGDGSQPKSGAMKLLLSLSEGTPGNEAARDTGSHGARGSGDTGKSTDWKW